MSMLDPADPAAQWGEAHRQCGHCLVRAGGLRSGASCNRCGRGRRCHRHAAGGRCDAALIGELLSTAARRKGIAGVVVDGAIRDVATVAQWPDFQVYTRWITSRGPSTMERGMVDGPVIFGGVRVAPRDLVLGDDDGLVIVPNLLVDSKLKGCIDRLNSEIGWRRLVSGRSTLDVFNVPPAARASN